MHNITLSLLLMGFFFVYPFWQCEVEENTDHNYSLSVRCILSLCCSVSDNCTFFFLKWVFGSFFVVVFRYALRETVNNCIIH